MLKTISEAVFSLVFPVSCELCGALLPSRGALGVCRSCQKNIALITPPWCAGCGRTVLASERSCANCRNEQFHFDRAYACVYYDEKMKKLLHAFKFERRRCLLPFFRATMEEFLQRYVPKASWDLVIPVPMDLAHERERGFNQARLLSSFIAKKSSVAHAPQALSCRKTGAVQSSLKKIERRKNAADRFFVQKADGIPSARILLIDDILTTGQTASACAKALKTAGAAEVSVLALARGL